MNAAEPQAAPSGARSPAARERAGQEAVRRVLAALRPALDHTLGVRHLGILLFLRSNPGVSVREVSAEFDDMPKPSITRNLDGLIRLGWVRRQPHADDGRLWTLALTADGLAAVEPLLNLTRRPAART